MNVRVSTGGGLLGQRRAGERAPGVQLRGERLRPECVGKEGPRLVAGRGRGWRMGRGGGGNGAGDGARGRARVRATVRARVVAKARVCAEMYAEAGTPCLCLRHASRVAVCISMLPPPCDRLAASRREGSGEPRTLPQTHAVCRRSRERLHRKRLPQTNHLLLPPPYYSAALLKLAPLLGPPLAPATRASAARPCPSPTPSMSKLLRFLSLPL